MTKAEYEECHAAAKFKRANALTNPLTDTMIAHHIATDEKRVSEIARVSGETTIKPKTPPTQILTNMT